MGMRFSELQCKEVICLCDGRRLGFVSDLCIELPEGRISAIIVPGPCRFLGLWGRRDDYVIPFCSVRQVGPDVLLVDCRPENCRVPRAHPRLL